MTPPKIDLARLLRDARAATPGKRLIACNANGTEHNYTIELAHDHTTFHGSWLKLGDAEFLASCTPEVIASLVEALNEAIEALDSLDRMSLDHTTYCLDSSGDECICYAGIPERALAKIRERGIG